MLIQESKTTFIGGSLDVICILHNIESSTYHAAFFQEQSLTGPIKSVRETDVVRLRSKMHHTKGSTTLEEAIAEVDNLSVRIKLPEDNIWKNPIEWNGKIPITMVVPNWRNVDKGEKVEE